MKKLKLIVELDSLTARIPGHVVKIDEEPYPPIAIFTEPQGTEAAKERQRRVALEVVERVNLHDELVEALDGVMRAYESYSNEFNPSKKIKVVADWMMINDNLIKARKVMSKIAGPRGARYR